MGFESLTRSESAGFEHAGGVVSEAGEPGAHRQVDARPTIAEGLELPYPVRCKRGAV